MNSEPNLSSAESETDSSAAAVETVTDGTTEAEASDTEATALDSDSSELEEYESTIESSDVIDESIPTSKKSLWSRLKLIIIPVALILLILIGTLIRIVIPFKSELGQEPKASFPSFLVSLDTSAVDGSTLGEYTVPAKIFGVFDTELKLRVVDTTPPSVTLRVPTVMSGEENVSPEDFVADFYDEQSVEFSFASTPSFSSETTSVVLLAVDESGNTARLNADCIVSDKLSGITFELGTSSETILSELSSLIGAEPSGIGGLDAKALGQQFIRAEGATLTLFTIGIVDTTAPSGEPNDLDLLIGTRLIDKQLSSLVKDAFDESPLEYSFYSEPDWDKPGKQTAGVRVTDQSGNSLELEAKLSIHDIPTDITMEAGSTTEDLEKQLFAACPDSHPELIGDELRYKTIGEYYYLLRGEYSDITISVKVEDTIPPVITAKDLTTDRGALPYPGSFIESCEDATAVSFSYETEPNVSSTGDRSVTIIATDAAGNEARISATLTIIADTQPPVISGVKNIYAYEGDTISYRSGVSAIDASDGRVTVYVDSSQVKTSTAGTYVVTYRATDSSGNTANASAYVYIRRVTQETLDSYADEILDEILTYGMTEREKAKAIYDWCRDNLKYSTVTSHLMGLYYKAAYSGYRLHYGNCYTYYAVARSLLTRAGITNQMIQRNNPSKPHYWNLVKIDGSWYHFDTCPQPYPNNDGCFLLTDSEVAAYSKNKEEGYYSFAKGVYPATP